MGCDQDKEDNLIPEVKYSDRVSDVNMATSRRTTPLKQHLCSDVTEQSV